MQQLAAGFVVALLAVVFVVVLFMHEKIMY